MFKKLMYDKIVTQLNDNTLDTIFQGGYLIGLYGQGIPYVVDSSTLSAFDYQRIIVIPVSEEYFTETPSVHAADRSDYVAQYQIMFQTSRETEVMTVMDEFRDAFFDDKQFTLDGYNVSIKTTRGEKQAAVPVDGGDFYVRFKINVYLTAIKNGMIWADSDKWEIRLKDTGSYEQLKLNTETTSTIGMTSPSSKGETVVSLVANTNLSSKISFFYNEGAMETKVYEWIMNKLDKDTLFDIRHTFNSVAYNYVGLISGGARTRTDNGVVILEFDWVEADI